MAAGVAMQVAAAFMAVVGEASTVGAGSMAAVGDTLAAASAGDLIRHPRLE